MAYDWELRGLSALPAGEFAKPQDPKEEMKIYWVVTRHQGLSLVRNPEHDIFESREEAENEAKKRGYGYQAMILNAHDAIFQLAKQNRALIKENNTLRMALEEE